MADNLQRGPRDNKILELLMERHRIEVSELAGVLGVSEVTTRKDLASLEARGIIMREHGFAELASRDAINGRLAYHYEEKLQIAQKALELVHDGDTVMIESGSCCALLAAAIVERRRDVHIITNSAFIADYVRRSPGAYVTLLGGDYQNDSQVMVGPMVRRCAEEFYVERLFVGVDGWSEKIGFTNADQLRAEADRDMARQAERVCVLTESEKFSRRGIVPLRLDGQIREVITDASVTDGVRAKLVEQGIEALIADGTA